MINTGTGRFENDRLERFKMGHDQLNSQITGQKYASELKVINGNKILLFKKETSNFCYYRVMSVNRENNKSLFATIEYKKIDEAKATVLLNYFLNHLKFK